MLTIDDLGSAYGVLGPVVAAPLTDRLPAGRRREWAMLSILLMSPDRPVMMVDLIDAMWPDRPPRTCREQILNCSGRLRQALARSDGATVLVRRRDSFTLVMDPNRVDHVRFVGLQRSANAHRAAGDPVAAVAAYAQALGLWRGAVLAGSVPAVLIGQAAQLEELRSEASDGYFACCLETGQATAVVADLTAAVRDNPMRERTVAMLMRTLHVSGRTAAALAEFRRLRLRLHDDLGIEPGAELHQLYQEILQANAHPAPPSAPSEFRQLSAAVAELRSVSASVLTAAAAMTRQAG